MEELRKAADEKMYESKRDYYKTLDRKQADVKHPNF